MSCYHIDVDHYVTTFQINQCYSNVCGSAPCADCLLRYKEDDEFRSKLPEETANFGCVSYDYVLDHWPEYKELFKYVLNIKVYNKAKNPQDHIQNTLSEWDFLNEEED